MANLPNGFGYLQDPRIIIQLAYHTDENFMGRRVDGYHQPVCIATQRVLAALSRVQDDLDKLGHDFALKIFDAYRPQRAVAEFERWSYDANDNKMQSKYYPELSKRDLFAQGYILTRSTHSRGSAVDLTIIEMQKDNPSEHKELDMGTIFDFFGDASHTDYPELEPHARANRQMLRLVMEKNGFKNYHQEWWHYNLVNEEFPDTYFDFPIE